MSKTVQADMGSLEHLQTTPAARLSDRIARGAFFTTGISVLFILGFIVWTLLSETITFFNPLEEEFVTFAEFFGSTQFIPTETSDQSWGIWPLITGTFLITIGASIIGLPIGLGTAIYLSEYAKPRVRAILKPVLEILAGIPSIVFGFFALHAIRPIVRDMTEEGTVLYSIFGMQADPLNALTAIIVVGVMVIPIIASISEDAIRSVPMHLREASYGMGANKWETTSKVVIPAALSGITASFVLGVARAVGETMAVTMAAGSQAAFTLNPLEAVRTMTAFIVQHSRADTTTYGTSYSVLFAVGFTLFLLTLALNITARRFIKKYQEVE